MRFCYRIQIPGFQFYYFSPRFASFFAWCSTAFYLFFCALRLGLVWIFRFIRHLPTVSPRIDLSISLLFGIILAKSQRMSGLGSGITGTEFHDWYYLVVIVQRESIYF
jgi:hypothetical protein